MEAYVRGGLARFLRSGGDEDARWALARQIATCEDRAMEAYVRGLARFLRSPERYPAARSLRLEFFLAPPPPEDHDGAAGSAMAECLASAFRWPSLERLAVYAFPRGAAAGGDETKQPAHVFPDPEPVRALLTASRVGTLHVKIELPGAERARLRAAVPRPDEAHRRDHAACQGRLPAILLQRPRAVVPGTRVPAPRVVLRRRLRPVRGGSAAVVEAP
ncbi:uncharacterized protein LOC120680597 [Panicum virgatum]|nr:uncharacterized protein LOC120680597 [Panicum virgatum]